MCQHLLHGFWMNKSLCSHLKIKKQHGNEILNEKNSRIKAIPIMQTQSANIKENAIFLDKQDNLHCKLTCLIPNMDIIGTCTTWYLFHHRNWENNNLLIIYCACRPYQETIVKDWAQWGLYNYMRQSQIVQSAIDSSGTAVTKVFIPACLWFVFTIW